MLARSPFTNWRSAKSASIETAQKKRHFMRRLAGFPTQVRGLGFKRLERGPTIAGVRRKASDSIRSSHCPNKNAVRARGVPNTRSNSRLRRADYLAKKMLDAMASVCIERWRAPG